VTKIHIITTTGGEPQLDFQIKQISDCIPLHGNTIKHTIIKNLPAKASMQKFYNLSKSCQFSDYILKLDGDMTFVDLQKFTFLRAILNTEKPQRLTVPVYDHITNCSIYGCHFIRTDSIPSRVTITETNRDDWIAKIPGLELSTKLHFIDHCRLPTEDQKFIFGFNRGHKLRHKRQNTLSTLWLLILFSPKRNIQGIAGYISGFYEAEANFDNDKVILNNHKSIAFQKFGLIKILIINPLKSIKSIYQACKMKMATPRK